MTLPIKPSDVYKLKHEEIPPEVFEAFNELIIEHWDGRESRFTLKEALDRASFKCNKVMESQYLLDRHWMDVEPYYREQGWDVKYDRPAWNESGESYYIFIGKKNNG